MTAFGNSELGPCSVITTVCGSGVVILSTVLTRYDALPFRYFSRSSENFTSAAVTGLPSENLAAGFSLNVQTVSWALALHDCASRGIRVLLSLDSPTSVS